MPYKRSKKSRAPARRRLQGYSAKQKNEILKGAARTIAGGYAAIKSRGFTPKAASSWMKSKRESSSGSSAGANSSIDQGLTDYRKSNARYGRKMSIAAITKKANQLTLNSTVYSIYNYGVWNRGAGNLMVRSNQPAALSTTLVQPVHLWDLTGVPQGQAANISYPSAFYELSFSNETSNGVVGWTTHVNGASAPAQGLDQHASNFTHLFNPHLTYTDKAKDLNLQNYQGPGSDDILEKVHCTMVLNGPQQKSTKWCIQVVQLSTEVTPGIPQSSSNEDTAFWQSMARPYGYSPLEPGPRKDLRKNIKVLKTLTYIMDSPESNEDHLSARMRHIDFTMYFNRKQSYRWGRFCDTTNMTVPDVPNDQVVGPTVFSTKVDPKARIYLMIRALCEFKGPNVAPSNAQFPSYDIKMDITHKSCD